MPKRELTDEVKRQIDDFLSSLHMDVQGVGGTGGNGEAATNVAEDYIIKVVTKFIVSLCTAWWSFSEILEYIRSKRSLKDLLSNGNGPISR